MKPPVATWLAFVLAAAFVATATPSAAAEAAASAAAPAVDMKPAMEAARVVGDSKRTRFIADLTQAVPMSVFTLADPYRIVVDLPDVGFRFASDADLDRPGTDLGLPLRRDIAAGKSRIVIDLTGPVKIDKSFVLDPVGGRAGADRPRRRADHAHRFPGDGAGIPRSATTWRRANGASGNCGRRSGRATG